MSQYNESAVKTFQSAGALAQYLRVKLSAGVLALAGSTDVALGYVERAVFAADYTPVRVRTAQGTCIHIASVAIAAGGDVYAAAGGKVAATGTLLIGTALTAATADGDQIEVLRF